jgi:transposase
VLGLRLASVMSYLAGRCHDGRRTVREIVSDLFGVPLSLGSVCNYEAQMSGALAMAHEQAVQSVRQAPVRHVDETGWSKAGKTCWLWTAATERLNCFALHAGRNWPALCALLGRHAGRGIICSDRWHAYSRVGLRRRQVCWAHLKRDFQKWSDKGGPTKLLGDDGLDLCRKVFALWRDFRQRTLTRRQLQRRLGRLRRRMRQVLEWNKACGEASAAKFCRNLLAVGPALWTFSRVPGLEPTNNSAERALRPAVLWRKNCFGCHSDAGLRFTERILTAIQSLRQQQRSVLPWLEQTLIAHRNGSVPPQLA